MKKYMIKKYKTIMDNVNEQIIDFFKKKDFKVYKLISIFESVEKEYYDNLIENINQQYKKIVIPVLKELFKTLYMKMIE